MGAIKGLLADRAPVAGLHGYKEHGVTDRPHSRKGQIGGGQCGEKEVASTTACDRISELHVYVAARHWSREVTAHCASADRLARTYIHKHLKATPSLLLKCALLTLSLELVALPDKDNDGRFCCYANGKLDAIGGRHTPDLQSDMVGQHAVCLYDGLALKQQDAIPYLEMASRLAGCPYVPC